MPHFSHQASLPMSSAKAPTNSLRWAIALALGLGLAACSDKPEPAAPATAAAAAAEAAVGQAAQQQAAALAALSADELKTRGRQALREQRIYSPAGNNAMEYYIALRKKSEKPDASAESALMDLQPYAVIAAEQAIGRADFLEAERLRLLIQAADSQAPSLTRIADAIAKGKAAAAQQGPAEDTRTPAQIAAEEAARKKALDDARVLQAAAAAAAQQREAEAAAAQPAPTQAPAQQQEPPPAAVVAAPPVQRPTPQVAAPRPAANELVAISTPQPAYPPDAARSKTSGQVVVSFTVNSDGSVSDIDIVSSRPRGVFERNVQAAVRRWKYQPIAGSQTVTRTFDFAQ
jgi:protein TonB